MKVRDMVSLVLVVPMIGCGINQKGDYAPKANEDGVETPVHEFARADWINCISPSYDVAVDNLGQRDRSTLVEEARNGTPIFSVKLISSGAEQAIPILERYNEGPYRVVIRTTRGDVAIDVDPVTLAGTMDLSGISGPGQWLDTDEDAASCSVAGGGGGGGGGRRAITPGFQ